MAHVGVGIYIRRLLRHYSYAGGRFSILSMGQLYCINSSVFFCENTQMLESCQSVFLNHTLNSSPSLRKIVWRLGFELRTSGLTPAFLIPGLNVTKLDATDTDKKRGITYVVICPASPRQVISGSFRSWDLY